MMNLIKVLVPFVGLVAANNATSGNGTTTTVAATTNAATTTTVAANTTAAPANTTAAAASAGDSGNKTEAAQVIVDVPVTFSFKGVKGSEMATQFDSMTAADLADISYSGARRLALTKANAKLLLIAAAKGFATAIGGASATKKVSVNKVAKVDGGDDVKITFRVTMTGKDATAAAATALETKVKDTATFKKALGDAVAAEVAKENAIKDFTPTVQKIDAPVTTMSGGVTKAPTATATTTAASSGAVSFVAPAGAMLMAMFALF